MDKKAIVLKSVRKKYPPVKTLHKGAGFDDFWALKDVDYEVEKGQTTGIIGRNGAGKTTLLFIIAGVLSPTEGEILVDGKVMGLFNLGVGFQDELNGRENIFLNGTILGAGREEIENKLDSIVEFSELGDFINMPLGSYSQGMRLRLGFSIIANLDFDILVIDEVLAVGDALFQNKCFERLIDFKRRGKTLVITTQAMDFIERLCDRVMLLDHGRVVFAGDVAAGINKYRSLLNSEKFFVGHLQQDLNLVRQTKRWADNISDWGQKFGGKEIVIDSVEFIGRNGTNNGKVDTQDPLTIKVHYTARQRVEDPHFGIAIFRKDGVYCYGPNTKFDGYRISELKKGRGHFTLFYRSMFLAPGTYRVSVAIWDKKETLAFDHHYGCYELVITGDNKNHELTNMPFKADGLSFAQNLISFFRHRGKRIYVNLDQLEDKFGHCSGHEGIVIDTVRFLDAHGNRKDVFVTNEAVRFQVGFDRQGLVAKRGRYLWIGIYRDDGVYCQGMTLSFDNRKVFHVLFPQLALLPGQYSASIGVWDCLSQRFLMYHHGVYPFRMIFNKQDHGTVYMEHEWR